ncbi:hypothetical protein NDU88_010449 [Pleurodeles waltl]|uniref:Uncharacterized protein n=1 Tax=Pleurodeles waltl TaxID=8319 RepID=A0AAV7RZP2_PLEWA|nr:hypothetical protein NDU88_010449 [Pleurodeles waltl]
MGLSRRRVVSGLVDGYCCLECAREFLAKLKLQQKTRCLMRQWLLLLGFAPIQRSPPQTPLISDPHFSFYVARRQCKKVGGEAGANNTSK